MTLVHYKKLMELMVLLIAGMHQTRFDVPRVPPLFARKPIQIGLAKYR